MSLYYVNRQHAAENCPASNSEMGNQFLGHISPLNARKYGVKVVADAVLDGQHTFVLILESDNQEKIEQFMQPFAMAGSVAIQPASHCEIVVERAGC